MPDEIKSKPVFAYHSEEHITFELKEHDISKSPSPEGYTWPRHPYTEPVTMLDADGIVELFERRMDVAWNNMRIMVGGTPIRDMVQRMKTSRYWAQRYYRFKRKNPALVRMYWQGSLDEPTGPSIWSCRTDVSGSPG